MQLEDCDRLAVGKKADIVMIDLNQPNMPAGKQYREESGIQRQQAECQDDDD